jgi:glycosidase/predicted alpha/beta superfamily hydrolase
MKAVSLCRWLALFFATGAAAVPPEPALTTAAPRFTHAGAGQTLYFVLTDRFANGRTDNDTGGYAGGAAQHGFDPAKISHYHGGDFAGLTAKLDYLKNLGVTSVWVTPPFKNKPMQGGTAGYHGYWITDFLAIDPHLGTDAEFREFIRQAHARGLRVTMDIIVNHTANVIEYPGRKVAYRPRSTTPYRDEHGKIFDERKVAYNGLGNPAAFPALSAARSFPYVPTVPRAERTVKNPAWLNDVTLYHNRGDSTWAGESAVLGDFATLDDTFTEHPRVVLGMIEIFTTWLRTTGVDAFRIDTAKHVNAEFWQAFAPAIRAEARALGRPDFLQFGEVYHDPGDAAFLSEFSTSIPLDTTIDFGFFTAARKFVSKGGAATELTDLFDRDDYYTDHDSNVHATTTFLGNHDAGRFGYFLQQDNPAAAPAQLADLVRLGHGLLYLARGQPVLYYGDEQGMIGRGGNDMQAREDMFPAQAPDFRTAPLLATARTGADDKFDEAHPFYRFFAALGALRAQQPALRTGATLPRTTGNPHVAAFSRIERGEKIELVVALNNSRTRAATVAVPTAQTAGAWLQCMFDSQSGGPTERVVATDQQGRLPVSLAPLQFSVWRAERPLAANPAGATPTVALAAPANDATLAYATREIDGQVFPTRQEIRAEVTGGDGFGEVTFTLRRASRPGQTELLGVDDTPPYRVFWRPPPDLAVNEELTFFATFTDLRGRRASAHVERVKVGSNDLVFGIRGATVPVLKNTPPPHVTLVPGNPVTLVAEAEGTGPLEYQWLRDDEEIPGAMSATLRITAAGRYAVVVRNRAGTTLGPTTTVPVAAATQARGRIERHANFASKFVAARHIDVWLPPGYDADRDARFPVIYMHDGQNVFEAGAAFGGSSWEIGSAVERLMAQGEIGGVIVVGVWNTGLGRFAEYMPQKAVRSGVVPLNVANQSIPADTIRSDAYLKFLVDEAKPFVDRTYRTRSDAAHTFVMGSSMGGLISAYALAEYPDVFGGAGCVSTHWPAGDGCVIDYVEKHLPRPGAHKFYFDFGTATLDAAYEPYQLRMDAVMRAAGYTEGRNWLTRKFPGAEHSENAWRERVEIPLQFLLRK